MNRFFRNMQGKASAGIQLLAVAVVLATLGMAMFAPHGLKKAFADTQNYGPSTSVYAVPLQLAGTISGAVSSVAAIKLPYGARLIGFTAKSRAFTGPTPAPTLDLRAGNTSVLTAPLTLSTVGVTEASIATAAIADETTLSVDVAFPVGTSSVSDTTVLMTFVR
jgi:hypothetical protein